MSMHMAQSRELVTAHKRPFATGQIDSELQSDARAGMLRPQSLAAWLMWLASSRHGMTCGSSQQGAGSHNNNDTCVHIAMLLTFCGEP